MMYYHIDFDKITSLLIMKYLKSFSFEKKKSVKIAVY